MTIITAVSERLLKRLERAPKCLKKFQKISTMVLKKFEMNSNDSEKGLKRVRIVFETCSKHVQIFL